MVIHSAMKRNFIIFIFARKINGAKLIKSDFISENNYMFLLFFHFYYYYYYHYYYCYYYYYIIIVIIFIAIIINIIIITRALENIYANSGHKRNFIIKKSVITKSANFSLTFKPHLLTLSNKVWKTA